MSDICSIGTCCELLSLHTIVKVITWWWNGVFFLFDPSLAIVTLDTFEIGLHSFFRMDLIEGSFADQLSLLAQLAWEYVKTSIDLHPFHFVDLNRAKHDTLGVIDFQGWAEVQFATHIMQQGRMSLVFMSSLRLSVGVWLP